MASCQRRFKPRQQGGLRTGELDNLVFDDAADLLGETGAAHLVGMGEIVAGGRSKPKAAMARALNLSHCW